MPSRAFYDASLACLRFVEARSPTGRRFGADADAHWRSFRGHLTTSDRIDLLLRDADAAHPGSFGASHVFSHRAVSEDEPFGADWTSLSVNEADLAWQAIAATAVPSSIEDALLRVAAAWSLAITPLDAGRITPATKLVVAGPSAIAAVVAAFSRGSDLSFVDQVTVIATPHGHRQLACVAAALLNAPRSAQVLTPAEAASAAPPDRTVVSPDADAVDAAWVSEHFVS